MFWEDLPEAIRDRIETEFDTFGRSLGTIESPSRHGLFFLINEGSTVWNAWAKKFPDSEIDFSYFEFRSPINFEEFSFPQGDNAQLYFAGSKFYKYANFSRCIFSKQTNFEKAEFLQEADFEGCSFPGEADFSNCEFHLKADFDKSTFHKTTKLNSLNAHNGISCKDSRFLGAVWANETSFNGNTDFSRCIFEDALNISHSQINGELIFSECSFLMPVNLIKLNPVGKIESKDSIFHNDLYLTRSTIGSSDFSRSKFLGKAIFSSSEFSGENYFKGCIFQEHASFRGCAFHDHVEFDLSEFKKNLNFTCLLNDFEPEKSQNLKAISFSGCEFHGIAKFDNRNFTSKSNFAKHENGKQAKATVFHRAPTYHGCKFHQDNSFHGAKFIQDYGDEAAKAYRTLKLAFEQLKSVREEQRFFKHEMQAERPDLTGWNWMFSWAYGLCSDYGFSIWRPLATLVVLSAVIGIAHGAIANAVAGANWKEALTPRLEHIETERTLAVSQYVLINSIPAPGIDKTQQKLREDLFKTETIPSPLSAAALFLEFVHKFIALLCVFLSGLAVRNLLKMKS